MVHMRKTLMVVTAVMMLALVPIGGPALAEQRPRGIPDEVMLQAQDLGGVVPGPVEEGLT
jgi:hypothetical protein